MPCLHLKTGEEVLLDEIDFRSLSAVKWHKHPQGYAYAWMTTINGWESEYDKGVTRKKVLMHRLICLAPRVDHINGNKLDNRRANLRPATASQNNMNRGPNKKKTCGTKSKGVRFHLNGYEAFICVKRKYIHLGRFATEELAARAYDEAAKKHFGEFARLNGSYPR